MAEQNTNIEVKFLEYCERTSGYHPVLNQETPTDSFSYPNWETLNWEMLFPSDNYMHTRFQGKIARNVQLHIIDLRGCNEAQKITAFDVWWEKEKGGTPPAVVILLIADPNFDQDAVYKIFNIHKDRFAKIEADAEAAKIAARAQAEKEAAELKEKVEEYQKTAREREAADARKAEQLQEMQAKLEEMLTTQQRAVTKQQEEVETKKVAIQEAADQPKIPTIQQKTTKQQAVVATKEAANQRFHKFWMLILKSPWTYFNPTVGVLMMSLAVIIGGLITAFGSATHLTAATPCLTGIMAIGAIWATLTFPFYVYRECRQHFNAWRMKAWEKVNQSTFTSYEYYRFDLTKQDPNMPGFDQYLQSLPSQIFAWIKSDFKTFVVVILGLAVSILLLVGAIGFFTTDPLLTFMAPLFDVMNTFISGVLNTISFPISTPIVSTVSAVLLISTILTGVNLVRLIARADNQARLAGGSLVWGWTVEGATEIGFEPDDPKNNFEVALDLLVNDTNMMSQGKNPFYNPSAENDGGSLDQLRKNDKFVQIR